MRFDSLIRLLLPREERFHELFSENTRNLVKGGELFLAIANGRTPEERSLKLVELKGVEHEGDQITRRIFEALNSTFLTPLDREDIRAIAVDIDDVLDYLEGIAQFLVLFEADKRPPELSTFAEILFELVQQIDAITGLLCDQRHVTKIHDRMVRVSDLENQADAIYISALGALFRSDSGLDAIEVLKWKEIYQGLEDACDKCKDFTHVVGNIVIKNA
jgi:predicted phosphate transport protein (TIGR00153 family)